MPAVSKAQQKAAGAALSAKRGETPKKKLKGASRSMVRSMSERQLEELAETPRKRLPERKSKKGAGSRKSTAGSEEDEPQSPAATVAHAERNRHLLPSRRIPRG